MEISLETIATMTDDRCSEVWPQISEAYTPAICSEVRKRLRDFDNHPRMSLILFAKYFNGQGRDRVLRRRKQLQLQREFETVKAAVIKLFHIAEETLADNGRYPRVVAARMFMVRIMHRRGLAYPDICKRLLGHKAHASVITSDQRLRERMLAGDTFEVWDGGQFVQMAGSEILERLEKP